VVAQRSRSLRFDLPTDAIPARALVTGGNKGIGAAVTDELERHGTQVVVAARHVDDDLDGLATAAGDATRRCVHLDLGDLDAVVRASDRLVAALDGQPLDLVVLNAGIAPRRLSRSPQGHELAFAVNVLGHHVLLRRLLAAGAVGSDAAVVVVTGDLMVLARDCTPDYASDRRTAGVMAYARSKLGCIWLATETATRLPGRRVVVVHPGVVQSELTGVPGPWQRLTNITPALASQTVLAAAFSPDVASGSYVHNTLGLLRLHPDEPAADAARATAFVERLDLLAAPWLATQR
jgi:NAD(P)-dependent dehydrogenase (short-subunit alcohol dehydrogenase family)